MTKNRLSGPELEALAAKPPEARERAVTELDLSRGERRRLEREVEAASDRKHRFGGKLTTRKDVVQILALYLDRNVRPFEARLNAIERYLAYLQLPLWRRVWIRVLGLMGRLSQFLSDRLGVTLLYLTPKEKNDGDVHDHPEGNDDGEGSGPRAPAPGPPSGRHEADRLVGPRLLRDEGDRPNRDDGPAVSARDTDGQADPQPEG